MSRRGPRGVGAVVVGVVVAASVALAASAGCGRVRSRLGVIERSVGVSGWFAVERSSMDATFASASPDTEAIYRERFSAVPLGRYSPPCDWLARTSVPFAGPATGPGPGPGPGPGSGPGPGPGPGPATRPAPSPGPPPAPSLAGAVWILVPGVKGDGPEWWPVLPLLSAAKPAHMYMLRWLPYAKRDELAESFAGGVSRLAECLGKGAGPFVVLAHSAGGVIASRGAANVRLHAGRTVRIVTVASPLAGTGDRKAKRDGREESTFLMDLGTAIAGYPPAAPGVEVLHLRTSFPRDSVMKPNAKGHAPNERGIGVPGAREVDLSTDLGHDDSLLWVTRALLEGRAF